MLHVSNLFRLIYSVNTIVIDSKIAKIKKIKEHNPKYIKYIFYKAEKSIKIFVE